MIFILCEWGNYYVIIVPSKIHIKNLRDIIIVFQILFSFTKAFMTSLLLSIRTKRTGSDVIVVVPHTGILFCTNGLENDDI